MAAVSEQVFSIATGFKYYNFLYRFNRCWRDVEFHRMHSNALFTGVEALYETYIYGKSKMEIFSANCWNSLAYISLRTCLILSLESSGIATLSFAFQSFRHIILITIFLADNFVLANFFSRLWILNYFNDRVKVCKSAMYNSNGSSVDIQCGASEVVPMKKSGWCEFRMHRRITNIYV